MIGGILEIAHNDRFLSLYRGFVCIKDHGGEIGRVPLDDLTAVLLTADQISLSKALMTALMERGIPLVSCGAHYHPDGMMLPYGGGIISRPGSYNSRSPLASPGANGFGSRWFRPKSAIRGSFCRALRATKP
jgi:CRISPR-associated protein Cas1